CNSQEWSQRRQVPRELTGPGRRAGQPDRPKHNEHHKPGATANQDDKPGYDERREAEDRHRDETERDQRTSGQAVLRPLQKSAPYKRLEEPSSKEHYASCA